MDNPVKISCRFTLSHPPTVDQVFLDILREWMSKLGMEARVCDSVPSEGKRSFSSKEFCDFAAIAMQSIAARRNEWIGAFGKEPMAGTTNEVFQRVVLPRCQTVVEQA